MPLKTLKDFNFEDKTVILRVDYNVPIDEEMNITSDKRIRLTLPTINYLLEKNAKIIIITHLGRPNGKIVEKLRTNILAKRLSELLNKEVKKIDSCIGEETEAAIKSLSPGEILMLENIRFNKEEKSKDEKERFEFGRKLALMADIYINDAFAASHRKHASIYNITEHIPGCAGFVVENEVKTIKNAIENPEKPLVSIIGGLKADKISAINNLLKKADKILIGGALSMLFLRVLGLNTGDSKVDEEGLSHEKAEIRELIEDPKIVLPVDVIIANKFCNNADKKVVLIEQIPDKWQVLDIGPATVKLYTTILNHASTIIWNGPLGVFEMDNFAEGTKKIAQTVANSNAKSIIGGGDSAAAIEKFNLQDKVTHVSSGGGASLMMFEGKDLPSIRILED